MAVLAILSLPNSDETPDSTPRRIVSQLPSLTIEVVEFQQQGNTAIPYVWIRGTTPTEFESVLADDPQISEIQQLEQTDDGALYKTKWEVDDPLIHCIDSTNGVIVQARGTAVEWHFKIWFERHSDASGFQQCCKTQRIPLHVERLTSLADLLSEDRTRVSQQQHEALFLAHKEGYFDNPRQVSQAELGDELGISAPAVGTRLRRGVRNLIEETLYE